MTDGSGPDDLPEHLARERRARCTPGFAKTSRWAIQVNGSTAPSLLFTVIVVVSVLLFHGPGPDAHQYFDWCRVFATGDIFELRGHVATPRGLPSTWYSLGPGLMMAPPYLAYDWATSGEGF